MLGTVFVLCLVHVNDLDIRMGTRVMDHHSVVSGLVGGQMLTHVLGVALWVMLVSPSSSYDPY